MSITKRIIAGVSLIFAGTCVSVGAVNAQPVSQADLTTYNGYNAGIYRAVDNRTGVYKAQYVSGGKTTTEWCYLVNGEVQYNYTGFASNSNGWWYIEKGRVTFNKNDVIKGNVKGQDGWWFVKGSKVQFVDSVEKNSNGWWKIKNGKVDFGFTGLAKNSNGWWYCKGGKVDFGKKDVLKGTVNGETAWWYVSGGKVQFVDSVEKNSNGWWRIKNGKVDFNYTGLAQNSYGWWYCKGGKVDFGKKDVLKGTVNGESGWWFVSGGQVKFIDSVEKNSNGWWAIFDGKVDFSYDGMATNNYGTWYCKNGKVDFSYNGTINTLGCFVYTVKNGKAVDWYEDYFAEMSLYMDAYKYIIDAYNSYKKAHNYIQGTSGSNKYRAIVQCRGWLRDAKQGFYNAYEKTMYVTRFEELNEYLYEAYYYMPESAEDNWDSLNKFLDDEIKMLEAVSNCYDQIDILNKYFVLD